MTLQIALRVAKRPFVFLRLVLFRTDPLERRFRFGVPRRGLSHGFRERKNAFRRAGPEANSSPRHTVPFGRDERRARGKFLSEGERLLKTLDGVVTCEPFGKNVLHGRIGHAEDGKKSGKRHAARAEGRLSFGRLGSARPPEGGLGGGALPREACGIPVLIEPSRPRFFGEHGVRRRDPGGIDRNKRGKARLGGKAPTLEPSIEIARLFGAAERFARGLPFGGRSAFFGQGPFVFTGFFAHAPFGVRHAASETFPSFPCFFEILLRKRLSVAKLFLFRRVGHDRAFRVALQHPVARERLKTVFQRTLLRTGALKRRLPAAAFGLDDLGRAPLLGQRLFRRDRKVRRAGDRFFEGFSLHFELREAFPVLLGLRLEFRTFRFLFAHGVFCRAQGVGGLLPAAAVFRETGFERRDFSLGFAHAFARGERFAAGGFKTAFRFGTGVFERS